MQKIRVHPGYPWLSSWPMRRIVLWLAFLAFSAPLRLGASIYSGNAVEEFSGGTSIREYDHYGNTTWSPSNTTLAPNIEYIRGSDWGGG